MSTGRDDYLWDRSGPPDPEVARLEHLLERFRYRGGAFLPAIAPPASARPRLTLAATVLIAVGGAAVFFPWRERSGWKVEAVEGSPRIGWRYLTGSGQIRAGEELQTDGASRARIEVGRIGTVEVAPDSKLRLVNASADDHRLKLDRGRLDARVSAPPRLFFVETPSATAVDLGCAYVLEVDAKGNATLRVTTGQVVLEDKGHTAYLVKGSVCETRIGHGVGTPHFVDDPQAIIDALRRYDLEGDEKEIDFVIGQSQRDRDSITLWNLLVRASSLRARAALFDRIAKVSEPPEGVTREGCIAGDRKMLDAWMEELKTTIW